MKEQNIYYKNNHLFSYGCKVMAIIGVRGMGKTYSTKKYILKEYFRRGKVFCWMRDNENSVKEICSNNGASFFKDISEDKSLNKYFINSKITVKDGTIRFNNKIMGYFFACSTFYKLKGNSYSDIDNIVYDEFIAEKTQAIRGNRALEFLNMIETIGRLRTDYKVILTANALDKGDEIINALGIKIQGFGYYVNRSKSVVVHYAEDNPLYLEKKLNSISGMLANNTEFSDNLLHNDFMSSKHIIYKIKPKNVNVICIFRNQDNARIRFCTNSQGVYCMIDNNESVYKDKRFVSDIKLVSVEYRLAPTTLINAIRNIIGSGELQYESDRVFNIAMSIFSNKKK